jgi:uncharacterized protein (DUF362 family)/Pyruvate/2-oxoacid:ferredoxin oxidoreductase delta subunit
MHEVIIRKSEYTYPSLRQAVFEMMDSLAGEQIQRKGRVVIKPNLLAPASPDKAIVTHPLIVKAVVEYVLDKGARPSISDSSAVGSFDRVLRDSGIKEALSGLNVEYKEFKGSSIVDVGEPFKKIEIASDALNADVLINLPKLKTHMQMVLTLGVKNLFGCIVGMKKPEWHFRTGVNREMFAQLLVKIYGALNPSVTLMDGVLAMEGQGPGKRGEPRHLGVLLGSKNAAALDMTVCRMLGISPDTVLTNKFAAEQGLVTDAITINGDLPQIKDFKLPDITPLVFGPEKFHGVLRRHLVQRPECDASSCRLCGECWKYCPAKAITHSGKKVHFDYDKCIRCYCCIEVCPHGALSARETLAGKLTRKLLKM